MDIDYKSKYIKYKIKYFNAKNNPTKTKNDAETNNLGGYGEFTNLYNLYNNHIGLKNNYTLETINLCKKYNLQNDKYNLSNFKKKIEMMTLLKHIAKIKLETSELLEKFMHNIIRTGIKNDFYFSVPLRIFMVNYLIYKIENKSVNLLRSQKFFDSQPSANSKIWNSKNELLCSIKNDYHNILSQNDDMINVELDFQTDMKDKYRKYLISTNMTFFGNDYNKNLQESTYDYWLQGTTQLNLNFETILTVIFPYMNDINEEYREIFIKKITDLYNNYIREYNKGILYQILIPDDKINKYVYASIEYGKPLFDLDVLDFLNMDIIEKGKTFYYKINQLNSKYKYIYNTTKTELNEYRKKNISSQCKRCIFSTMPQSRIVITPEFVTDDFVKVFYHCPLDLSEFDNLIEELKKNIS